MTKPKPPSCGSRPPAYTRFAPTDAAAYLWFDVSGLNVGDILSDSFYAPSGQLYTGGLWDPVSSAGEYCFTDELDIVGNAPASMPGTWTVKVSYNGTPLFSLSFTITAAAVPQITAVVNAASLTRKVARGSLATIFGTNFANAPTSAFSMPLPKTLAGVSVNVGGVAAPLLYVSATQINFQVPCESPAGNSANVVVTSNGSATAPFSVAMADYGVGVFMYARELPDFPLKVAALA